jgi:S-DNA-T family DNA segregation ATPase FtsK/SpoIIIE
MARIRDTRPTPREDQESHAPVHEFTGLILLASGLVIFLSLISYAPADLPGWMPFHHATSSASKQTLNFLGVFGAILAFLTYSLLGSSAYLVCAMLLGYGSAKLILPGTRLSKRALWSISFVCSGACLAHLVNIPLIDADRLALTSEGGWFGKFVGGTLLQTALGSIGAISVLLVVYAASILYMTGVEPREVLQLLIALPPKGLEMLKEWLADRAEKRALRQAEMEMPVTRTGRIQDFAPEPPKNTRRSPQRPVAAPADEAPEDEAENQPVPQPLKKRAQELVAAEVEAEIPAPSDSPEHASSVDTPKESAPEPAAPPQEPARPAPKIIDGTAPQPPRPRDSKKKTDFALLENVSCEGYQLPPIDLLDCVDESTREAVDPADLLSLQNTIVETLQQFGIEVSPGDITRGPTITRYEVYPAKGVRVDRILALERDLARATRAERINILAPIPGKDTVGIEIANSKKQKVTLRELFESEDFASAKAKIPIALGKDVYGKTIVADLAAMPHGLVAGTTGSGKSVCINAIIASILYRFTPEELRFIMIDPKVVEMQMYNTLPHLVVPVVTDPKKVLLALRWAVDEMEKRYAIFAKTGVRNIASFNSRPKPKTQKELDEEKKAKQPELFDEALRPAVVLNAKGVDLDESGEPDEEEALASANAMNPKSAIEDAGAVLEPSDSDDEDAEENPESGESTEGEAAKEETDDGEELDDADAEESDDEDSEESAKDPEIPIEEKPVEERIAAMTTVRVPRETDLRIPEKMSYIVIIVDELADLMQTAPADVESAIARITQKARAAGIHMIIATQTPRADVITGVIKANVPCRVAFQVASALDSRVILDENGAEKLLGQGDMLYRPPGTSRMIRAQGVLVTDEEVKRLVEFSSNQGGPKFENSIQARLQGGGDGEGEEISDEDEELVDKCIEIMQQEKKASTSLFQRRLRLGYTRAARILDILENRGYVGPGEGAKPREILVDLDTL